MIWRAVWVCSDIALNQKIRRVLPVKNPMRGAQARHFATVRPQIEVTSYHPGYHLNRVTTL